MGPTMAPTLEPPLLGAWYVDEVGGALGRTVGGTVGIDVGAAVVCETYLISCRQKKMFSAKSERT